MCIRDRSIKGRRNSTRKHFMLWIQKRHITHETDHHIRGEIEEREVDTRTQKGFSRTWQNTDLTSTRSIRPVSYTHLCSMNSKSSAGYQTIGNFISIRMLCFFRKLFNCGHHGPKMKFIILKNFIVYVANKIMNIVF